MVSIKHIEDLEVNVLLDLLSVPWDSYNKYDGSYFEFGWDEQGRRYTGRKNAPRCYELSDWSSEMWANDYRLCHPAAMTFLAFIENNVEIKHGTHFSAELMFDPLPNSIPNGYYCEQLAIAIITSHPDYVDPVKIDFTRLSFASPFDRKISPDGKTESTVREIRRIVFARDTSYPESGTMTKMRKVLKIALQNWMNEPSIYELTTAELMSLKLNKKPAWYRGDNWIATRVEIKQVRDMRQQAYRAIVKSAKKEMLDNTFNSEGWVIRVNGHVFKLVDQDIFLHINHYTHMVKYWLVGGRRPNRPSFLSRTKDWPVEKRLARLDVLLERFQTHKGKLIIQAPSCYHSRDEFLSYQKYVRYDTVLNTKTLNLFYDTRKRIENGR